LLTLRRDRARLASMRSLPAVAAVFMLPLACACAAAAAAVAVAVAVAEIPLHDFRQPLRKGQAVVGMECHKKNGTLEVGAYYPTDGPLRRMDLWQVSDLVEIDAKTFNVAQVRRVERSCVIGNDRYRVQFEGLPGAANAMWQCGALMTATVTVWQNDRQVLQEALDDNPCRHVAGIRRAVFRGGAAPDITRASP